MGPGASVSRTDEGQDHIDKSENRNNATPAKKVSKGWKDEEEVHVIDTGYHWAEYEYELEDRAWDIVQEDSEDAIRLNKDLKAYLAKVDELHTRLQEELHSSVNFSNGGDTWTMGGRMGKNKEAKVVTGIWDFLKLSPGEPKGSEGLPKEIEEDEHYLWGWDKTTYRYWNA